MWLKWFPWRLLVRKLARGKGFLDPIEILAQLQNFAQPAEVTAPTELLRSGVILHARGLMNSLAIQHNLDWVWPYWVECQYDPRGKAFIPRSFTLTQINLTHRNWTAIGLPECDRYPIVDPRGLVTPLFDGWSIDAWVLPSEGEPLLPSRLPDVDQRLDLKNNICVTTDSSLGLTRLRTKARVVGPASSPVCQIDITGASASLAWLVVALRPYNPEGVSFVHEIALLDDRKGWQVGKKQFVYFDQPPDQCEFSYYHHGDVYNRLPSQEDKTKTWCKVGMATAAAMYRIKPGDPRKVQVQIPLIKENGVHHFVVEDEGQAAAAWDKSLQRACVLQVPDEHFQFLYDAAVRTMVLHSPREVYPGPYIYRRFWFRDAAFILYSLLSVGLKERASRVLECFRSRQTPGGYFLSQEGEWDANGEALWIMQKYCQMTGEAPPAAWKKSIEKGGHWIVRKLLPRDERFKHSGLLPAGFSAEHLGPNDFYFWDDFWAVAGLNAAGYLLKQYGDQAQAKRFYKEAEILAETIGRSLAVAAKRIGRPAMPASPYRRLDSGSVGSLACGYPVRSFAADDPRLLDTVEFLLENCLVNGGFFHDMTHSGINPYLTLHLAQVLLRAGDPRYFDLMTAVAKLASPTGQWPEAVHPATGGGCMGDGQHVWAAAEWVLMLRNCFVREEEGRLVLGSGIPAHWLKGHAPLSFGPAPTEFGDIQVFIKPRDGAVRVEWSGKWFGRQPLVDVQLPGFRRVTADAKINWLELKGEGALL